MGFTLPYLSPNTRCALTAPFQLYFLKALMPASGRRLSCIYHHVKRSLLSVALSVGSRHLDVIQHHVCMKPGLSLLIEAVKPHKREGASFINTVIQPSDDVYLTITGNKSKEKTPHYKVRRYFSFLYVFRLLFCFGNGQSGVSNRPRKKSAIYRKCHNQ